MAVARAVEISNPELVIAGILRVPCRAGDWTIDVLNRVNGQMISLNERDDWSRRLQKLLPNRSIADARLLLHHEVQHHEVQV